MAKKSPYTHVCTIDRSKNKQFFASIASMSNPSRPVWNTETYHRVGTVVKHLRNAPFDYKRLLIIDNTELIKPSVIQELQNL
jgi:hypothetical protein